MDRKLKALIDRKIKAEAKLQIINDLIKNFDEGYWYCVMTEVHRYSHFYDFNNHYAAELLAGQYYGDNGFSTVYTNNPDYKKGVVINHYDETGYYFISSREALDNYVRWCSTNKLEDYEFEKPVNLGIAEEQENPQSYEEEFYEDNLELEEDDNYLHGEEQDYKESEGAYLERIANEELEAMQEAQLDQKVKEKLEADMKTAQRQSMWIRLKGLVEAYKLSEEKENQWIEDALKKMGL
jgi:hypothetical protein